MGIVKLLKMVTESMSGKNKNLILLSSASGIRDLIMDVVSLDI